MASAATNAPTTPSCNARPARTLIRPASSTRPTSTSGGTNTTTSANATTSTLLERRDTKNSALSPRRPSSGWATASAYSANTCTRRIPGQYGRAHPAIAGRAPGSHKASDLHLDGVRAGSRCSGGGDARGGLLSNLARERLLEGLAGLATSPGQAPVLAVPGNKHDPVIAGEADAERLRRLVERRPERRIEPGDAVAAASAAVLGHASHAVEHDGLGENGIRRRRHRARPRPCTRRRRSGEAPRPVRRPDPIRGSGEDPPRTASARRR